MRRNFKMLAVAMLLAIYFNPLGTSRLLAVELTMYCNPVESLDILTSVRVWEKKTGNKVVVLSGPAISSDVLALYQQQLTAGNSTVDLYEVESIWAGFLGKHFIDLRPYSKGVENIYVGSIIENNSINGRLISMPIYLDVGMIFYRKDLLQKYNQPIPKTWQELALVAKKIMQAERAAGNKKMWGFVFQGRAYEGLTCCALEWINSFGGGTIVDSNGNITINNLNAVAALKEAAAWIGDITPKKVLSYSEEEARGVFQSGNAVFMRNWSYAWGLGEAAQSPIKGKIGVTAMPKGSVTGNSAGALGGWSLAVSKYSKNQQVAADLLFYITSKKEQQKRLSFSHNSYIPSVIELIGDAKTKSKNQIVLIDMFNNAINRPAAVTGSKYDLVSSKFYGAVHSVLSGKLPAERALGELERSLKKLKGDAWN